MARFRSASVRKWSRLDLAILTVLVGLPLAAGAASFPDYPLQTGTTQVPPNILFVLDDSGSMGYLRMPVDMNGELSDSVLHRSPAHNTVYYDPSVTYDPWLQADGTRMSVGTSVTEVYPDYTAVSGTSTINLMDPDSCNWFVQNGAWRQVCGTVAQRTYYIPKGTELDASKRSLYYRYQIVAVDGDVRVVRSEWARKGSTSDAMGCPDPGTNTFGWRNCTYAVPTSNPQRDEAAEIRNFATWFSYHRSRSKMAKAGASEAFGKLGNNMRVGFRTIWNRNNFDIPVGDGNSGIFEGESKQTWFSRLHSAVASGSTPLQGALQSAGEYYTGSSSTGPYGPESGDDQLQCRQNFTILTTDGYWNNQANYTAVGEQDSEAGPSILNPKDGTDVVRYTPGLPFTGAQSDTLGDIAMRYWKRDLRSDLDNYVPTTATNPAFWQHMSTFGISIGLKGTLDQSSVAEVLRDGSPRKNGVNVAWPDPTGADGPEKIDDLLHAAVNSRGEFVAANNARAFGEALRSVLGQIDSRLSSGSNVSTNSTSFQSDTRMYQATFMSGLWTGDLVAYDVTEANGISDTEAWRTSTRITASLEDGDTGNDFDDRPILTWSGTSGVDFPTSSQSALLERTDGFAPATSEENVAYIRGDQSLERASSSEGKFRNRARLLGDIVNSSPFYVKDTETLYVGANDGMMHAINALTGDVVFSYVPAGIDFEKLATYSDPNYQHAFFVDGPIAVSPQSDAGANYLVGALGRGGKGVFALDVTDPTSPTVLWDETASADADMGHVLGLPLVVRGNNDAVLAVVSNGIDSANGSAALYIYDVETGDLLRKIVVDGGGGNGLSAPRAADVDGDRKIDYIYAGDLQGNVWKFDVTDASPSAWALADNGDPFFSTPSGQPITGGIAIAREPVNRRIWITFGTGRLISTSDIGSTGTQALYALIDDGTAIASLDELTERTIAAVGTTSDGRAVRAFEEYSVLPAGSKGWYIELGNPTPGERVVSGPRIRGRAAFYSSIIPSEGVGCEPGGTGYLNILDLFTGTSPTGEGGSSSYFDLNGNGSGSDDLVGGLPIGSVDMGVGMPTESAQIDDYVVIGGSSGGRAGSALSGMAGAQRRVSWRELFLGD